MINDTQLNSSSVVIVSGGGRGITAQCVIYLAQQYHCKFILLGGVERYPACGNKRDIPVRSV